MKTELNIFFHKCAGPEKNLLRNYLSTNGFDLSFFESSELAALPDEFQVSAPNIVISDAAVVDGPDYLELVELKEKHDNLLIIFIKDPNQKYEHPLRLIHLADDYVYREQFYDIIVVVQNLLMQKMNSVGHPEGPLPDDNLKAFMDSMDERVALLDGRGRFLHVNRKWLESAAQMDFDTDVAGRPIKDVAGLGCGVGESESGQVLAMLDRVLAGTENHLYQVYSVAGGSSQMCFRMGLHRIEGWEAPACILMLEDVSRIKETEISLRQSEQKFSVIVNTLNHLVFTLDGDHRFTSCFGQGLLDLDISEEDLLGKRPAEVFGARIGELFQQALAEAAQARRSSFDWSDETPRGLKYYTTTILPIMDESKKVTTLLGVNRDITEKRLLQNQLIQTQRMEGIGQLAAGIAHDFNNLLNVMTGYADLLLMSDYGGEKQRQQVSEILKAGRRGSELTRQLLAFARKEEIEPRIFDINDVLTGIKTILQRVIGEDILLTFNFDKKDFYIKADPGQVEQILINLVVNARDAIRQKERWGLEEPNIYIETHCENINSQLSKIDFNLKEGPYLILSITDNGCGMDEGIRQKIFEPFYTTKPQEQGTGLGLSTVYGILKQNNAGISVYSEPGIGSTFKIYWPLAEQSRQTVLAERDESVFESGNEHILLVEDDENVRAFSAMALSSFGYRVSEAGNGRAALDLIESARESIDLIIADVVMPAMGGLELYHSLKGKFPEKNIILTSGYSDTFALQQIRSEQVTFLQKPYSMQALSEKVRATLDRD